MATPKLRFKEFDEDLEKTNLINLTMWASGGTPSKKNEDYWMGDIPLISGASMHTRKICESEVNITDLGLKKGSKLAPKNSILILVRGSMLFKKIPIGMALKDVAFNQDVKSIITKEGLNEYYFFQWLLSQENIIQNKVTSTGIGAGKLDTSELQNLEIYYPAKSEQTKIATFLSAVDTKIDELTQKHELLSEYKKGMMQQIFSQKLRFKGFSKEYKSVSFEDIEGFSIKSGKSKGKKETGKYPFYGSTGLIGYKDDYDYTGEAILIARVGANAGSLYQIKGEYSVSDNTLILSMSDEVSIDYVRELLVKFNLNRLVFGTGQPLVTGGLIKKISVSMPDLEEQTKIANFLTAIDQKIDNVAEQIDHAKTWKKGLLQQMFV